MTQKLILLVEDNEDDVFIMQQAIKKAGITNPLVVAEDGQKALDYLTGKGEFANRKEFPLPEIILLDLKLPKIMGLDVLKAIRNNPALPSFLVVVLSASNQHADVDRAYRLGANSYLTKPPSPEKLLDLVKVLGQYWFTWNVPPPGSLPVASHP